MVPTFGKRGEIFFTGRQIQSRHNGRRLSTLAKAANLTGEIMRRIISIRWRVLIWGAVVLLLWTGCGDPSSPDTDSETHWGDGSQLPDLAGESDEGDCEPLPEEDRILELDEWVGTADGVLYGDVVEVKPALDVGYSPHGDDDTSPIYDASECESVDFGFAVTLENLSGYLHDHDLPDELTIHFGTSYYSALVSEHRPDIDEDGVHWPEENVGIGPGMRIGGLVFEEPKLSGRWSFGVRQGGVNVVHQVVDGGLVVSKPRQFDEGASCRHQEPREVLEELGESGLLDELESLDASGELYVASEDRTFAVHGHPVYDEEPYGLPYAGYWFADCHLDDGPDECSGDGDCADGQCTGGECVECVDDAGCEPGAICHEGECVTE